MKPLAPLFLVVKLESGINLAKIWLFRTELGINLALLVEKFGFEKEKLLQKSGNTASEIDIIAFVFKLYTLFTHSLVAN